MPSTENSVVYVLHSDTGVREVVTHMLRDAGQAAYPFPSSEAFWNKQCTAQNSCMILDPHLEGCGLAVHEQIARRGLQLPLIFMGRREEVQVPTAVRAMKAGAIDFLTLPLSAPDLMRTVDLALSVDLRQRRHEDALAVVQALFDALTRREKQIFHLVVTGLMNKQMAHALSLSEASIKIHRGNVMRKMGARTLVDLVHMHSVLHSAAPAPGRP